MAGRLFFKKAMISITFPWKEVTDSERERNHMKRKDKTAPIVPDNIDVNSK